MRKWLEYALNLIVAIGLGGAIFLLWFLGGTTLVLYFCLKVFSVTTLIVGMQWILFRRYEKRRAERKFKLYSAFINDGLFRGCGVGESDDVI